MSINLTAKTFSLENARELALYARMAYDEPPTIRDAQTDTNILIRDLGDCIVVSSKGTASLKNFITDAEFWRMSTPLGEIHAGFYRAWKGVETQTFNKLSAINSNGLKPILFDGHSLGGSLAQLAAKRARDCFFNVHSVYVYGCPRTGDKTFQTNYNATLMPGSPFATLGEATFTVINDCDIIPRMPGWLSGYRRPGHDEFISGLNAEQISEDPSLFYRAGSDFVSLLNAYHARSNPTFLDELLTDHHVNKYIAALDAIRGEDCPTDSPCADHEAAR